jgi:predicted small integral membrane protein
MQSSTEQSHTPVEPPVMNNPAVARQSLSNEPGTKKRRVGFLPIETNLFDRYFISIMILVAVHLLWFRFLEPSLSINIATVITLILMFVIVRWG